MRLSELEREPDDPDVRAAGRAAVTAMTRHARLYPIGWPRTFLFRGRLNRLGGRHSAAKRDWRRGLEWAHRLEMPLEVALLRESLDGPAAG